MKNSAVSAARFDPSALPPALQIGTRRQLNTILAPKGALEHGHVTASYRPSGRPDGHLLVFFFKKVLLFSRINLQAKEAHNVSIKPSNFT